MRKNNQLFQMKNTDTNDREAYLRRSPISENPRNSAQQAPTNNAIQDSVNFTSSPSEVVVLMNRSSTAQSMNDRMNNLGKG